MGEVFDGVAQLVRALPCQGRGRGFESRRHREGSWKSVLTEWYVWEYLRMVNKPTRRMQVRFLPD